LQRVAVRQETNATRYSKTRLTLVDRHRTGRWSGLVSKANESADSSTTSP
jgi:hypothetical protein